MAGKNSRRLRQVFPQLVYYFLLQQLQKSICEKTLKGAQIGQVKT